MQRSARNQLNATVDSVTHGFASGDAVVVVIKSTEVMLAKN